MSPRNLNPTEVKRLQREWRRRTDRPLGLLLDSVQTPYNVGAIFRTAAAYRVDHLWLAGASATPEHDKTRKTSLGTERLVDWSVTTTPAEAATIARGLDMEVVGLELSADAAPLGEAVFAGGVCVVVGHEDRGLSNGAIAACDRFVYVPTPGKVGSLNVATATAIALFEVRRQEWQATPPPSEAAGEGDPADP